MSLSSSTVPRQKVAADVLKSMKVSRRASTRKHSLMSLVKLSEYLECLSPRWKRHFLQTKGRKEEEGQGQDDSKEEAQGRKENIDVVEECIANS
mmetsp:Transcript_12095/g.28919  ORF Transcript_12095/g.28919 Transcript_12095/m.28919 type:complete len:94 (+) Transcript_12095:306-587(+)